MKRTIFCKELLNNSWKYVDLSDEMQAHIYIIFLNCDASFEVITLNVTSSLTIVVIIKADRSTVLYTIVHTYIYRQHLHDVRSAIHQFKPASRLTFKELDS